MIRPDPATQRAMDFEDLVAAVYDAVLDTARLEPALDAINAAVGAMAACLLIVESGRVYPRLYAEAPRVLASPSGGGLRVPEQTLMAMPTTACELRWEATPVLRRARVQARLAVLHDGGCRGLQPPARLLLRRLAPHVGRALEVLLRLERSEQTHRGMAAGTDRLGTGLVLLAGDRQVVHVNLAAAGLLATSDAVEVRGARLRAVDPLADAVLQTGIQRALASSRAGASDGGGALAIARPDRGQPVAALVIPIAARRGWIPVSQPAVAVLLRDPQQRIATPDEWLARWFGLTPAEARLAASLAAGARLADAARTSRLTEGSARQYLKRIFAKTRTHRQAALVGLLVGTGELI